MKEQLFIIKDGERYELDLNNPSGISLNYKSNLFGDLSKITCSHSYTFKLPMTLNNRTVLDNAEEIRSNSTMVRRKLIAEFYQNGIMLFTDSNLYIESVDGCYQAVMTWGVIRGLETLKDKDIPLNELPDDFQRAMFSKEFQQISEYDNTKDYLKPVYDAGLRFITDHVNPVIYGYWNNMYYPLPVVPVHRLIKAINKHFGTAFDISHDYDASNFQNGIWNETRDNYVFTRGVIPLVDAEWTEVQKNEVCFSMMTIGYGSRANYCGIGNILFVSGTGFYTTNYYKLITHGTFQGADQYTTLEQVYTGGLKYELDGCFNMKLECPYGEEPEFRVYEKKFNKNEAEVVASVKGVRDAVTGEYCFDFRESNGKSRLSFDYYLFRQGVGTDSKEKIFFFGFSHKPTGFGTGDNTFSIYVDVIPYELNTDFSALSYSAAASYPLHTVRKLPDISCMDFMKALFYMAGAFPVEKQDGSVGIVYYDELQSAIDNGTTLDWSDKVTSGYEELPDKISYAVSGYAQRNYYLTKTDKLESSNETKKEDEYASGIGIISVENECIEKDKTVITIPFSAPFTKSASSPSLYTGNTFKFWKQESDGSVKNGTANPICGIIECWTYKMSETTKQDFMGMRCWNAFTEMEKNPSYAYLQKILKDPVIITETLNLNEFDLRDIDYSVPVYLNKYNSYFAVVSIKRDSKGKCKCELIKLP